MAPGLGPTSNNYDIHHDTSSSAALLDKVRTLDNLPNKAESAIFSELKAGVLHESLLESVKMLPELIDEVGVPYQLNILYNIIAFLNTKQTHTISTYSFYLDPN